MLHSIKAQIIRLSLGAVVTLALAHPVFAEVSGFQDHYYAEVGGETWGLQLERNKTFIGVIIGHLHMGNASNRLVLMGSANNGTLAGTYKPFFQMGSGKKSFSLIQKDEESAILMLEDMPGFPNEGITFRINSNNATIDQALIGTWRTEPEFGIRSNEPYTAGLWVIEFKEDGTLCRHQFFIDTRNSKPTGSPCDATDSQRWKVEKNKILLDTGYNGDWQLNFNYRIMSGHLFLSYPNQAHRDVFSKDEKAFAGY